MCDPETLGRLYCFRLERTTTGSASRVILALSRERTRLFLVAPGLSRPRRVALHPDTVRFSLMKKEIYADGVGRQHGSFRFCHASARRRRRSAQAGTVRTRHYAAARFPLHVQQHAAAHRQARRGESSPEERLIEANA